MRIHADPDPQTWSTVSTISLKIQILQDRFLPQGAGFPLYPEIFFLLNNTMILKRIRIIVGEAGFEPGIFAGLSQKSGALPMSHQNRKLQIVDRFFFMIEFRVFFYIF